MLSVGLEVITGDDTRSQDSLISGGKNVSGRKKSEGQEGNSVCMFLEDSPSVQLFIPSEFFSQKVTRFCFVRCVDSQNPVV
jgi:hypothetical protein